MPAGATIPAPEAFRFRHAFEVRFGDLDAMGHVNNADYFTYFETARTRYMEALGYPREGITVREAESPFILGEISCRYLHEARLLQILVVHLRICRIGRKSFDFEYLVTERRSGRPVATGWSAQIAYDYDAGRTCELSAEFLERVERLEGGVRPPADGAPEADRSPVPAVDGFNLHHDIEVRFRDLDAMGHVNNAMYFTYLEVGRTAYMRALGYVRSGKAARYLDFPFIMAEIRCRYLAAGLLGQTLRVHLRTARIGDKSFEFEYLVTDAESGAALATGRSAQVYYDYDASEVRPVSDAFRAKVEKLEGRTF